MGMAVFVFFDSMKMVMGADFGLSAPVHDIAVTAKKRRHKAVTGYLNLLCMEARMVLPSG